MNIRIGSKKEIILPPNLDPYKDSYLKKVMDELTLPNPAYFQAKKYSPYSYTTIPQSLFYYTYNQKDSTLTIPRGFSLENEEILDNFRVKVHADYPNYNLTLRRTQRMAADAYLNAVKGNCGDGVVVIQTGAGKSQTALYVASRLKQKALILVHKDDLVMGWRKDIEFAFGIRPKKIGLIKAKNFRIGEQFTIATVQTLSRMDESTLISLGKEFGMVTMDECLKGDTLIVKEDGGFKKISHVIDGDSVCEGGKVSNKFFKLSPFYKLSSYHGTIEGSPTHPTFCIPKWRADKILKKGKEIKFEDLEVKPLIEVTTKDYLPIIDKIPHIEKTKWTKEQLSFVALIMADGHLDKGDSKRTKINITPKDVDYYRNLFNNGALSFNSDAEVKESNDCRGNFTFWTNNLNLKSILINKFGIDQGKKSGSISINREIQYASLNSIKHFIATYFSCEADLVLETLKGKTSARIHVNSCSKDMIQGLSLLLKKFNIVGSYQEIFPKKETYSPIFRLTLNGEMFNRFMDCMGDILIPRKSTTFRNTVLCSYYKQCNGFILSRVKKEPFPTGKRGKVYDFTTESHKFTANGIITHNCHHGASTMYTIVHKYFPAFYRYGTTATNMRNDGLEKVLNFYYGNVCYNGKDEDAKEAIIPNDKVYIRKKCSDVVFSADKLVPTSTKRKPIKVEDDEGNELLIELVYRGQSNRIIALKINDSEPISIDKVEEPLYTYLVYKGYITEKQADYHEAKRTVIDSKDFNEMVVMDVIQEAGVKRKSCLVFCSEKEHIEVLRDMFIDKGYSLLLQLYYGNSTDKKEDIKQNAESRQKLITLATYAIATEGTNVKAWERMFMAMPVANEKDLIQAIGRVRRTNKGKEDCIIYDYQFPYVDMMAQQSRKRDAVYRKYKFVVESPPRDSSLQRGFPRR